MKKQHLNLFKINEIQNLYLENLNTDPFDFIKKYHKKIKNIDLKPIAEQISNYRKALKKFPFLSDKPLFIYDQISIQQSSSELAAKFKASLLKGSNFIDLTGGLGIDTLFISNNFQNSIYCEQNEDIFEIFQHNLKILQNEKNITTFNGNSIEYLAKFDNFYFDWIYIDPARRDNDKRFIKLESCSPDILKHMDLLTHKSKNILLKLAPAFDINEIVKKIPNVYKIIAVEINYEMKETLVLIDNINIQNEIQLQAIDLKNNFEFTSKYSHEKTIIPDITIKDENYINILHPSIIKLQLTFEYCKQFNTVPQDLNCNIAYTKQPLNNHRCYKLLKIIKYNEKQLKKELNELGIKKANIWLSNVNKDAMKLQNYLKISHNDNVGLFIYKDALNTEKIAIGTKIDNLL